MSDTPLSPNARKLTPLRGFLGVFTAVFLLVFMGSALITFLLPETFVAVARVRANSEADLDLYQSEAVLNRAAEQLDLSHSLSRRYGETQPFDERRTLDVLGRTLQVRRIRGTQLAEIRAFSRSPTEAAMLANAVAEAGSAQIAAAGSRNGGMIEKAVPPSKPARPNKGLNLGLGALVGAVLGAMAGGVGARLAVGVDPHQH